MVNVEDYNGNQLTGVTTAFLVLTYLSVTLRLYVRIRITRAFSADDWLMVVSQGVFTISCIFVIRGVKYGLGNHNAALSQGDQIQALKFQALATISYIANMMFIKLSIAIFLLRIAVKKIYIYILQGSMATVAIWSIVIFFYDIFQCMPVEAQWNFTIMDPKCVSGTQFVAAAYSISVMSILTDWLYALLPIPMIWSVQMTKQAKITVAFILSLGIFASVATLVRLKYLIELTSTNDILYGGTEAMVWTLVEPGVAIIAASLVTIRPLLRTLNLSGFESSAAGGGSRFSRHLGRDTPALRNDIPPGERWAISSISSKGGEKELRKVSSMSRFNRFKGSRTVVREEENDIGLGIAGGGDAGAWGKECILEGLAREKAIMSGGASVIGVTRTVDVSVQKDKDVTGREKC